MIKDETKVSLVLLAGGKGLRVGANIPKQFIELEGRFIAEYALAPFLRHPLIDEYVIVCDVSYRSLFNEIAEEVSITFVNPGELRQDSLYNGLEGISKENPLVFVHDAARPFFDLKYFDPLLIAAKEVGAAILAVPSSSTLKEITKEGLVKKTLNRSIIWEIQTPQVAYKKALLKGLEKARENHLVATDEASLIELLNQPVKVVKGDPINFKVTTPEDLKLADSMIKHQNVYDAEVFNKSSL